MSTVVQVPADDQALLRLALAQQREVAQRYADRPDHGFAQPPLHPDTLWLVLIGDGHAPVGCVAVQPLSHTLVGAAPDAAEVKRLYVDPLQRGHGHSRTLMAHAEQAATQAGYRSLQLETGQRQPEALALYRSLGYREIAPYGHYRDSAESVCFAKTLPHHLKPTPAES